jgi:hypothetical protein
MYVHCDIIINVKRNTRHQGSEVQDMIYTVFPKDKGELPQDFPTYEEAVAYGTECFGKDGYVIESTTGECV